MTCKHIEAVGPCKMPRHTPENYDIQLDAMTNHRADNTCYVTFKITFRLSKESVMNMMEKAHPLTFTKLVKIFAQRLLKY